MGLDCEPDPPVPEQSAPRISSITPIEGWFHHKFHSIPGFIWYPRKSKYSFEIHCLSPYVSFYEIITDLGWYEQVSGIGGANPHVSMETLILTTTCGLEYHKVYWSPGVQLRGPTTLVKQNNQKHWCTEGGEKEPWLVWLSGLSAGLWTWGLIVSHTVRAHVWVASQVPSQGCTRGNITLMFLSFSPSLTLMRILARGILCCDGNIQIHTDYRNTVEKKRWRGHSLRRKAPRPLPWQAFIVFLGLFHQRWSSFTIHRYLLVVYLLQTTKERMSLNTSKNDICNVKGEMVKTSYVPYLEGLAQILGR